jgi:DNA polymerase-3 subunit gamma/tau
MSRQALYRVYRPRRFAEVVGQSRSIRVLQAAVRQGRLSHAYCFSGPRGTGKTSVARLLAKAVNCQDRAPDGEPCLHCPSCVAMDRGAHLDVMEIDAASNRGIDEIREIRERVAHLPVMGSTKIYIIDEVHMLTNDAFNALLKTLEEPPAHVIFILATTEAHKVPLTVLSRCQRYQFSRLDAQTIQARLAEVLEAEQQTYEMGALAIIADAADGALRDALSLADQVLAMAAGDGGLDEATVREFVGGLDQGLLDRLLVALTGSALDALLAAIQAVWEQGRDVRQVLRDVAASVHDVVVFRTLGAAGVPSYRRDFYRELSSRLPEGISETAWFQALEDLTEAESRLRGGFPPRLVAEMALFKVQQDLNGTATRVTPPQSVAKERPSAVKTSVPVAVVDTPPVSPVVGASPPEPSIGSGQTSERFSRVLEAVRQERPSTYALLQYAEVFEQRARIVIWFQFPAHRDIIAGGAHREVLESAFRRVYGAEIGYDLRAGEGERPEAESAETPTSIPTGTQDSRPLEDRLQEVFGVAVKVSKTLAGASEDDLGSAKKG